MCTGVRGIYFAESAISTVWLRVLRIYINIARTFNLMVSQATISLYVEGYHLHSWDPYINKVASESLSTCVLHAAIIKVVACIPFSLTPELSAPLRRGVKRDYLKECQS